MKTIAFRFVDVQGPTDWVGIASAKDWTGLFWVIDEFGNPYETEYQDLPMGGAVCWREDWNKDADPELCEYTVSETERSERVPNSRYGKWKKFPAEKCNPYSVEIK